MNPNDETDLVPFGKYRGQPVESMLADQNYLQWVMAQPGLVAMIQGRYPALFNIINIGAPRVEDTPEHNQLQAKFLQQAFQYAFIQAYEGKSVLAIGQELIDRRDQAITGAVQKAKEIGLADVLASEKAVIEKLAALSEHRRKKSRAHYLAEKKKHDDRELLDRQKRMDGQASLPQWERVRHGDVRPVATFMTFEEWLSADHYGGWGRLMCDLERESKKSGERVLQERKYYQNACDFQLPPVLSLSPKIEIEFERGYDVDFLAWWSTEKLTIELPRTDQDSYSDYRIRDWEHRNFSQHREMHYKIELKPRMGDDFPSVLRQVKRNGANVLVIGSFEAVGCGLDEVRAMFGAIKIVTLAEIKS
jgi:hypothetical protein